MSLEDWLGFLIVILGGLAVVGVFLLAVRWLWLAFIWTWGAIA